jgi:hypothetical protein
MEGNVSKLNLSAPENPFSVLAGPQEDDRPTIAKRALRTVAEGGCCFWHFDRLCELIKCL